MDEISLPPFFYDPYGFYAYVMVNGDENQVNEVIKHLESKEIKCAFKGKSKRRASNGLIYNWFVRIFDSANGKPSKEIIDKLLYEHFGVVPVEIQIQQHRDKIAVIQNEVQELQEKIQESTKSQDEILDSAVTFENKANILQAQNEDLRKQIEGYKQVINAQQEQVAYLEKLRAQTRVNNNHETSGDIVQAIFPEIQFVKGSLDYLFIESEDRDWILRTINKLYNDKEVKSKRFESVMLNGNKIWREVDSDGTSRIYYAKLGNKFHVLVKRKKEQNQVQDILNNYGKEYLS